VMSGGRIVESGTHADLLEAGGLYARAWASQTDKGSNLTNRGSSGGRLFT
jgi:ABC-type transport system involved in cytochrome bd biosynthesis fused ATPase/permease subunit